jgi:hypothetical protein
MGRKYKSPGQRSGGSCCEIASPIGAEYIIPRLQRLPKFGISTQGVALGFFMSCTPCLRQSHGPPFTLMEVGHGTRKTTLYP